MGTTAAIISLVVGTAGTAISLRRQRQAQRAEEKAGDLDRRQADIANQRRIRQSIEQSRVQRAQLLAAGVDQGGGDSSGLAGGLGSANTQLQSNIGFASQVSDANNSANRLIGRARSFRSSANTARALGNLPSQLGFDARSSARILRDRFGGNDDEEGTS